jgi:hypothetical protein
MSKSLRVTGFKGSRVQVKKHSDIFVKSLSFWIKIKLASHAQRGAQRTMKISSPSPAGGRGQG